MEGRSTSSLTIKNNNHVSVRSRALEQEPEGKSTRRQFPECIEQNLSPKECQTFIEQVIESEGGHEVGDINVKIRTPRTPDVMDETYWMVEVPVNIDGKVACQINEGKTFYPFKWDSPEDAYGYGPITKVDVEDVDCLGLSAGECCLKILRYGRDLTEFGYDSNGVVLACFAHQVPLSPIVIKEEGSSNGNSDEAGAGETTAYLSYELFPKSQANNDSIFHPSADGCSVVQYSSDQVDAFDATLSTIYDTAYILLTEVLGNADQGGAICNNKKMFDQMWIALWNAAVTIPPLSQYIGTLASRLCFGRILDFNNLSVLEGVMKKILSLLATYKKRLSQYSSRDEHCIVIHTNNEGDEIVKIPELPTIEVAKDDSEIDPTSPCNEDIRVCAEGEYCSSADYYFSPNDTNENQEYECRSYLQLGQPCLLWGFPEEPYSEVHQQCDPLEGYCKQNPRDCGLNDGHFPANTFPLDGTCTPYGKICTKDNNACDPIKEYCHIEGNSDHVNNLVGRCEPKLQEGTCCDPNADENICEYYVSSDQQTPVVQLKCIPYLDFGADFRLGHICQIACLTDEECKDIDENFTTCHSKGLASDYYYDNVVNDEYGRCK